MCPERSRAPRPTARRGRRAAGSDTRADILEAARGLFATNGYDGTSLRAIAREAGVDPALVHHYFDGKDALFAASVNLDALPMAPHTIIAAVAEGPPDELGARIVRTFLATWDEPERRAQLVAVLRSAMANETASTVLRDFLAREVFGRMATIAGAPDAERAGALVGAQLAGLALGRYVLAFPGLADAAPEALVAAVGPTLQRYLTAD